MCDLPQTNLSIPFKSCQKSTVCVATRQVGSDSYTDGGPWGLLVGLGTFTAMAPVQSLGQGTNITQAMQRGQINKNTQTLGLQSPCGQCLQP